MNVRPIEKQCYKHQIFPKITDCIITKVEASPKLSRNKSLYELYALKALELDALVLKEIISTEEAKHQLSLYRIQLELQDRKYFNDALKHLSNHSKPRKNNTSAIEGIKVYNEDECIGAIVMGRCHGSIINKDSYHKTCYGEWLDGACTGPYF